MDLSIFPSGSDFQDGFALLGLIGEMNRDVERGLQPRHQIPHFDMEMPCYHRSRLCLVYSVPGPCQMGFASLSHEVNRFLFQG